MAFIGSPLAATATRNLPPRLAGAGSGVYNTTRQVGSVLGSAGIAALMTSQISAWLPAQSDPAVGQGAVTRLPSFLHEPFAEALSRSLLLPAFVALFGVVAALFLRGFGDGSALEDRPVTPAVPVEPDYFPDDDDYFEYTVDWSSSDDSPADDFSPDFFSARDDEWDDPHRAEQWRADDSVTSPLAVHPVQDPDPDTVPELITVGESYRTPEPIPARNGNAPWRDLLDDQLDGSGVAPKPDRIEHARNGFHVLFETAPEAAPADASPSGRHSRREVPPDDDAGTYGKHSMRFRD
jgi:hypothetical protein